MPRHFAREHEHRRQRARRAARRAQAWPARLSRWLRTPGAALYYGIPGGPMTEEELHALLAPEPPAPSPTAAAATAGALGRR